MQTSVIIGILFKLLSNKKMTANELAKYFEVSQRTIFRYLLILEAAGVPLERTAGNHGGVSIMESFRLGYTYFTAEEKLRIANSLKLAASNYSDKLTDTALDKLMSLAAADNENVYLLMTDTLVIDASGWNDAEQYRHKISAVNEGIFNNKLLKIRYRDRTDEISERIIEPHTLVLKEGVFYLYAYCRSREDFRTFKLARINSVSVRDETFTRRKIDNLPWNKPFEEKDTVTATVEVSEKILADVEEWLGAAEKEENSVYLITAKIPLTSYSVRKLLSYGAELKVVSPGVLIDKIREESRNISSLYSC